MTRSSFDRPLAGPRFFLDFKPHYNSKWGTWLFGRPKLLNLWLFQRKSVCSAVFTACLMTFGSQNIIHGKNQDQYFKDQVSTKTDGDSNFKARHKMFPCVSECYSAGKSVTPHNDCETLTIFCFWGQKTPNLSKRVILWFFSTFRQSKGTWSLVCIADPPFNFDPFKRFGLVSAHKTWRNLIWPKQIPKSNDTLEGKAWW